MLELGLVGRWRRVMASARESGAERRRRRRGLKKARSLLGIKLRLSN
jgi:hypothetical protein